MLEEKFNHQKTKRVLEPEINMSLFVDFTLFLFIFVTFFLFIKVD